MARNFARLTTSVWADPEWRKLGHLCQHMYLLLLSQSKLTLAGSLDVKVRVWADMAGHAEAGVEELLVSLERYELIAVDWDTEELVIRTFVKHDLVLANRKTAKGMWAAWSAIESPALRDVVLRNLPVEAFDPDAEPLSDRPIDPPIPEDGDHRSEGCGSSDGFSIAVAATVATPPAPPQPVENLGAVS